jgi:hypothetical protein
VEKMAHHTGTVDNADLIEGGAQPSRHDSSQTVAPEGESFDLRGARGFAIAIGLSIAAWGFIVLVFLPR